MAVGTGILLVYPIGTFLMPNNSVAISYTKEQTETIKDKYEKEYILKLIEKYSIQYNVKYSSMLATIKCEAGYDGQYFYNQQSNCVYKGIREDSWGVAQIHLPSHPDITKEQALDPEFAIRFMAQEFSIGHARLWTCWRQLK